MFNCDCRWAETIHAVVILFFALWSGLLGAVVSKWIVVIAAASLLLHAWTCKNCGVCMPEGKQTSRKKRR